MAARLGQPAEHLPHVHRPLGRRREAADAFVTAAHDPVIEQAQSVLVLGHIAHRIVGLVAGQRQQVERSAKQVPIAFHLILKGFPALSVHKDGNQVGLAAQAPDMAGKILLGLGKKAFEKFLFAFSTL